MVNRYIAARCSNTPSDRLSVFKFPSDIFLRVGKAGTVDLSEVKGY